MNMFNFNKIRRKAVAMTTMVALLVSCVGLEEDQNTAAGYLLVPSLEVDLTVDDLLLTKALDFKIAEPSVEDIHFVVRDAAGKVKYDGDGLWTEAITLAVGSYTIEASCGSNIFGFPYFKGTASGSITALENENPQIRLSLANSLMRVRVSDELAVHFEPGSEVVMNSGAYTATYGEWFYAPSGSNISLSLAGLSSAGIPAEFEYVLKAPSEKVAYDVICGQKTAGWPSITLASDLSGGAFEGGLYFSPAVIEGEISQENAARLVYQIKGGDYDKWTTIEDVDEVGEYKYISGLKDNTSYSLRACIGDLSSAEYTFTPVTFASCLTLSASASHTENASGELSGTEVNATVSASLPSIVAELSEVVVSGSFLNSASAVRGSFASTTLSGGNVSVKMNNASGWPYIPQGAHTLNVDAVCTLPGGRVVNATVSKSGIPVPEPVFEVLLSAYTSYDKATGSNNITKNVTDANNCDPSTLYNLGASWAISDELMANANYAKTLIIDFNGDTSRTYELKDEYKDNQLFENISGLDWTNYTLQASFTFDGKTVSTEKQTHHVTGLPYKTNPMVEKDWSLASWNCEYNNGTIQIGGVSGSGEATATSAMKFHIPSEIGIKVNTNVTVRAYRAGLLWCNTDFTVSVNGSQIIKQNSDKQDNNNTGKNYNLSGTSVFTPSGYSVKMNSSYTTAGPWSKIHSMEILYN